MQAYDIWGSLFHRLDAPPGLIPYSPGWRTCPSAPQPSRRRSVPGAGGAEPPTEGEMSIQSQLDELKTGQQRIFAALQHIRLVLAGVARALRVPSNSED